MLPSMLAARRRANRTRYPRVGFIVTNMTSPTKSAVAFHNHRGTAEQNSREGKNAIKRPSYRSLDRAIRPALRRRRGLASRDPVIGGIR